MKFTTPCFVCIEDATMRDELLVWLKQIGYGSIDFLWGNCIRVIRCWTSPKGVSKAVGYPYKQVRKTDIDCGSNIELFKALAAINDDNDRNQWFVRDCGCYGLNWVLCRAERIYNNFGTEFDCIGRANWAWEDYRKYRKAIAEEIIEHFKNKK